MLQPASFTLTHAIPTGYRLHLSGISDPPTQSVQDLNQMTSMAGTLAVTTGSLIAYMVGASTVIPIFGAAVAAAVGVAILIEKAFSGCGQTCTEATNIANQVADRLNQNVQNYFSFSPRYKSMQDLHLGVFDSTWKLLLDACGNPALGSAGRRCISERQRGGTAPWCPNPGHTGCDWFILFRDPIANDPNVLPDPDLSTPSPAETSSTAPQVVAVTNPDGSVSYVQTTPASSGFNLPMPFLLIGGLILVSVLMLGSSK